MNPIIKAASNLSKISTAALAVAVSVGCAQAQSTQSTLLLSAASGTPTKPEKIEYHVGGPLEGLKLPPHPYGVAPEVELYPGGREHWREYFMKYLPSRALYDAQSQLKNWNVAAAPNAPAERITTWAPPIYQLGRDATSAATGKTEPPAKVIRAGIKNPIFKLELGNLPIGVYAIRVIGAVETAKLRPFRTPLFIALRVNDESGGGQSTYRQKISYVDDFYAVAELFFHADEAREYSAEVWIDEGSQVELLVHNISLDNALAGTEFRAVKTRQTQTTPEEIANIKINYNADIKKLVERSKPFTPAERAARDEAIWNWTPPVNAQSYGVTGFSDDPPSGTSTQSAEQIVEQWGEWKSLPNNGLDHNAGWTLRNEPKDYGVLLRNEKLKLQYTVADYKAGKALPDPFPLKDAGSGLTFPDATDPAKGKVWAPIAREFGWRLRASNSISNGAANVWLQSGSDDWARDAAINLVRYAYDFPARDRASDLNFNIAVPGYRGRDTRFRQRHSDFSLSGHYQDYGVAMKTYDLLFPYIKGNEALAASISRFVPWVKNSSDVVKLIDTYLVQTTAKRIMRYHWYTFPTELAKMASVLGDPKVADPMMEWLFSKTFVYPLQPAGIQDLMITGTDREGPEYIGSTFYSQQEGAIRTVAELQPYLDAGGSQKYNLADAKRFPKPLAHAYWQLNTVIGGQDFLRIGDVTGPEKPPGLTIRENMNEAARWGWKWSKDPQFAWIIKNLAGRKQETDAQWKEIETFAAKQKRAPWLDLPSREINNWAGILESGIAHDDYRFRRAVYVRAGLGYGHHHNDTLDLQGFAHGVPFTIDDGQRSGYTKPNSRFSRIHNTVEVDGKGTDEFGLRSHAWVQNIAAANGANYLRTRALPPPGARYFSRQVALIDVDEGSGSQPLTIEQQKPDAALPKNIVTPNSYIFDVFRVSGGSTHLYNFHGPVNDNFAWNVANEKPVEDAKEIYDVASDANILSLFTGAPLSKFSGDAASTLTATWRLTRDGKSGSEQQLLGKNFDEAAPRKFTRLHLLDNEAVRALRADVVSVHDPLLYRFTNLSAVKRGTNLESVFAAIIEPYSGAAFINSQRVLTVANNESDALRPVAVEVKTKNGNTDINFADGRPERIRKINDMSFSGEFAFVSHDGKGFRQATLSGGTLLSTPEVRITTAAREYSATVQNVNYAEKRLQLDKSLPAATAGRVFEIGTPQKWTSYTIAAIDGSTLTTTRSADFYRSPISQILPGQKRVDGALASPQGLGSTMPGAGWIVSNDDASKFWRTTAANNNDYTLDRAAHTGDFPNNVMRLWEYGASDSVRLSTLLSLRRMENGLFELRGDVDATIALQARKIEFSSDCKNWRVLSGKAAIGLWEVSVGLSKLPAAAVYLRVTK